MKKGLNPIQENALEADFTVRFSHIITKEKCDTKPSEIGGGILADEMGMGKSLSILALVTKTLESAHAWKNDEAQSFLDEMLLKLHPSRATLVLVPSACR